MVKKPPASAGDVKDVDSVPGSGRISRKRKCQPAPVFLLGESQGQRSLLGCSPWGHAESDTTEAT